MPTPISPIPVLLTEEVLVEIKGRSTRKFQALLAIGCKKRSCVVLYDPESVSRYSLKNKIVFK